jgi:hypothetical protein
MTVTEVLEAASSAGAIEKKVISAPEILNEAYCYARPSSFSRGLRIDVKVTLRLSPGKAGGWSFYMFSGGSRINQGFVSNFEAERG